MRNQPIVHEPGTSYLSAEHYTEPTRNGFSLATLLIAMLITALTVFSAFFFTHYHVSTYGADINIENKAYWQGIDDGWNSASMEALSTLGHDIADGDAHQIMELYDTDWEEGVLRLIDEHFAQYHGEDYVGEFDSN